VLKIGGNMNYIVYFWAKKRILVNGKIVLGKKMTVRAKTYQDTPNEIEEMKKDTEDWKDGDPVCNGVAVFRKE